MTTALKVSRLTKSFKKETVFENVNLELPSGSIYGFVGHNGSGKSVFFKVLCGILLPNKGTVSIFGQVLGKDIDFPDKVGAVIETPGFLPEYSGFKNLKYLASIRKLIGDDEVKTAMARVGLDPNSRKSVKKYSLGMKQRLALAQAIMERPQMLILDEPMNGLDKTGVKQIRELLLTLKAQGTTILLSSHMSADIHLLCDHVYEFDNKTLVEVTKEELVDEITS
ncbi:ATP-binding cassette domain-containing protein [Numidum massiliense]|uniref:ATP-binding cassette domain-containing protein n=1 Tax=Numidum massiliense TaxID=1522315 RepID=UPI0006D555D9|nr:ATP-binding cassette domain-containing protein [Numidum massiliense]